MVGLGIFLGLFFILVPMIFYLSGLVEPVGILGFLIAYIIEMIIEVVSIKKLKESSDYKYWNIFKEITIAIFVSTVLAYYVNLFGIVEGISDENGGGYFGAFVCILILISNLILLIIGLITRKSIKKDSIKLNKSSKSIRILVILLNVIILIISYLYAKYP